MSNWIDGTLYPDTEIPVRLTDLGDRIDFLSRLCSAWDFGILPYPETVNEIRSAEWSQSVDACRLLTSPAYHLLRRWHNLPALPYLGQRLAYIADDPNLDYI
ncbi:MAG: hypothetical protein DWI57_01955 [Chloroflexi bacterium]|nr:MAG: hypothetical protein DWI57_01955 [Chloroflexota bacterium]